MKDQGMILKKSILGLISILLLTLFDQWTKILAVSKLSDGSVTLIPGVFEFLYIKNHGAAWGILSGQRILFVMITVIVMVVIGFCYLRTPNHKKYMALNICEIMLFSGALGNMIDRIMLGYVRDFLYFSLIDFPVFNVADCYVVISAILLCVLVIFVYKDEDFYFLSLGKKKEDKE
ncbi:MAG: signal peptidase II [Lachnospiraceae bacterium]